MKMLLINSILQVFLSCFLMSCSPANHVVLSDHDDHGDHKVALSIEKDREDGFFLFKLTNENDKDLETSPIGSNFNRIILIGRDGKKIVHYSMKDMIPIVVKPGETKTWRMNITPLLELYELQRDKKVQLIWSIHETQSTPFILNQRN